MAGPGSHPFHLGTADSHWLEGRPGRAHHLVFTVADPGSIPDTVARRDTDYEIDPDANFGVRLILRPPVTA